MKKWNGLYPMKNYMRIWRPIKKKKEPSEQNPLSREIRKKIGESIRKIYYNALW